MYPQQLRRFDDIRIATMAKLQARRVDLDALAPEAKVRQLVEEALLEFYDDRVTANYEWDYVERVVRRVLADESRRAPTPTQP